MKLTAINADITKMEVDCIVNASNPALLHGGGVCGAIFDASGAAELTGFIAQHYGLGCQTGQVVVTPGFNLPAKYILHTVGPDMREHTQHVGDLLLTACYGNCVMTAIKEGLTSIAFPAISTGIFGFDKKKAAKIAVEVMYDERIQKSDIEITFACFGDEDTAILQAAIEYADEQEHLLDWSVGDTHYPEGPNGEYLPDAEQVLDLDTDAPHGVWDVHHNHLGSDGYANGVTVKDGQFVLEPTLRACAVARNRAGYHGTFLEGLDWNKETDSFEAYFGS